ncbi:MAG: hypothetical protein ABI384_08375 [Allobranchiibius sp.]
MTGGTRRLTALVAPIAATALLLSSCGSSPPTHPRASPTSEPAGTYGPLPTYLPTATAEPDAMLTGSPARPAVASEGDRVLAQLPGGTVQAQVTGPIVPGEGLPYVAAATTCTWTIALDHATSTVPIRLRDFQVVDQRGHAYRLSYAPGTTPPPATLRKGQHTTFSVRVVMMTGEGVMRWQPGGRLLALWDFVVEND